MEEQYDEQYSQDAQDSQQANAPTQLGMDALAEAIDVNIEFMNKYLMKARQTKNFDEKMDMIVVVAKISKCLAEL